MKYLNGAELANFIKERQAKQVRGLRQAHHVFPRLAIIITDDNPASLKYIELKKRYGEDILIDVVIEQGNVDESLDAIERHNKDPNTHGIIVQLPISDHKRTEEVLNLVTPEKDVDGLGSREFFDPATPTAILWLLAGYNVDLRGKKVVVIGKGRLVGSPLIDILQDSGIDVFGLDKSSEIKKELKDAKVIISATGQPRLLSSDLIPHGCVVVDAGTASEGGALVGDVSPDVYDIRDDLKITPQKGGVGPLTVCALFDNVILSARRVAQAASE